jgi:hypothetical protein
MKKLFAAALLLAPLAAWANPPHLVIEVKPGDPAFERLYGVTALAVADPSIASAELQPSQEVLILGKKPGTTDVVAFAGGKLVGIRVHVRAAGAPTPPDSSGEKLDAVLKTCPKHQLVGEGKDQELGAAPSTPACRAALAALFATDRFVVKQIAVDFDEVSLQAQLAEFQKALHDAGIDGVTLHYQAATLVLEGTVSQAQAGKLALVLYQHAVGGVPLDDTDLEIEQPDAGALQPPPPIVR